MSGVLAAMAGVLADAGLGGGSTGGTISAGVSSTAWVSASTELEVAAGPNGQVSLAALYEFTPYSTAPLYVWTRWYEWTGSAWSPIGIEVKASNPAYYVVIYSGGVPVGGETYNGAGTCNFTRTGLTAGETRKFKLFARAEGNVTMSLSGSATAEGN